jgi:outer membrane lipoprotein-sorting protein
VFEPLALQLCLLLLLQRMMMKLLLLLCLLLLLLGMQAEAAVVCEPLAVRGMEEV